MDKTADAKLRESYAAMLAKQYAWEWYLTINVPSRSGYESYLKEIRSRLRREEGLQIAQSGTYSDYGGCHVHLVMAGKHYHAGRVRTLNNVDIPVWESKIGEIVNTGKRGKPCKIYKIDGPADLTRITQYITSWKNCPRLELLRPLGIDRLNRIRPPSEK